MPIDSLAQTLPAIVRVQKLLGKIDHLRLPTLSRRDVESILVRQASKEIDRLLPWQRGHGCRTAAFALTIGQELGMTLDELHQLKLAGYLHDIGLLMVPHGLTADHSALEPDLYANVQSHPRLGATLLEPFSFLQDASVLIAHHHERWDGSGYPYGIRGRFIPLGARILSIADTFDAIEVPNIQCPETRALVAFRILRVAAGTQFDPDLVETFGQWLRKRGLDQE